MTYSYRVVGNGTFPTDMLRYDAAWPADTASAQSIAPGNRKIAQDYEVFLQSSRKPTLLRWNSFGWGVFDVRGLR